MILLHKIFDYVGINYVVDDSFVQLVDDICWNQFQFLTLWTVLHSDFQYSEHQTEHFWMNMNRIGDIVFRKCIFKSCFSFILSIIMMCFSLFEAQIQVFLWIINRISNHLQINLCEILNKLCFCKFFYKKIILWLLHHISVYFNWTRSLNTQVIASIYSFCFCSNIHRFLRFNFVIQQSSSILYPCSDIVQSCMWRDMF